jgi:protein-disulfide isomerase
MKPTYFLICTAAVIALAACNNKQSDNTGGTTTNEPFKLEQVPPPPGGDWTQVVSPTPTGAFVMGNPNAKVKLIEYGSMTCPHCREFDESGTSKLIDIYVKSGQVSYEFRNYVRDAFDLSASLIARCNGAKSFFPLTRALYKDQLNWVQKLQATPKDQLQKLETLDTAQVPLQAAKFAGFPDWAAARGIAPAKSTQCLTDAATVNKLVEMTGNATQEFPDFPGTPTFVINGKMVELGNITAEQVWPTLESKIREALH